MNPLKRIRSLFKKERKKDDPLEALKEGDIVELDGESWEVVGTAVYDWGSTKEKEWELRSPTKRGFLSKEEGKIYFFTEIDPSRIEPDPLSHYRRHKKPPEEIVYEGKRYRLSFAGRALYKKGDESYPVTVWEFKNEEGEIIDVEIWGDYEAEAYKGRELQEWEIFSVFHT
ncbi:MAG: DUF4178 domain-containing protein [Aquificae bacterium]|nr:DUF4178 domain-containing protein [Aquificota bacterium]